MKEWGLCVGPSLSARRYRWTWLNDDVGVEVHDDGIGMSDGDWIAIYATVSIDMRCVWYAWMYVVLICFDSYLFFHSVY